ncbi:MAG: RluA family pseudouridine synthase, partial [Simkaniaceae bacterium]|nr:RluA family pseudouridine synthase [Simkaniaceae bacterium]
IPLNILYEDEHFIAVNKPAGMVVHPAPGHYDQTFVNALLFYCDTLEIEENSLRPGIVHRLDKETSGVLIAAKTKQMQAALTELFSERKMVKEYIAICIGIPKELKAFGKITRHPIKRQEMMFSEEKGKEAETHFEILDRGEKLCVTKAFPKTGRTHQIRVHLKTLGAPILGDDVYGNASFNERYKIKRQLLHAHALRFTHPITQEPIEIVAPLPEDMLEIIKKLQSRIIPK